MLRSIFSGSVRACAILSVLVGLALAGANRPAFAGGQPPPCLPGTQVILTPAGSPQTYDVPAGAIEVFADIASGAGGDSYSQLGATTGPLPAFVGGNGAHLGVTFPVQGPVQLLVVVGEIGQSIGQNSLGGGTPQGAGGGGGTFIHDSSGFLYVAAGGGGGAGATEDGDDASLNATSTDGGGGSGGLGGAVGSGGGGATVSGGGGGGAGFLSAGGDAPAQQSGLGGHAIFPPGDAAGGAGSGGGGGFGGGGGGGQVGGGGGGGAGGGGGGYGKGNDGGGGGSSYLAPGGDLIVSDNITAQGDGGVFLCVTQMAAPSVVEIPTLSTAGFAALAGALAFLALLVLRRRPA